jgi:arsenate reductase
VTEEKKKVLILCTGNSCRSQMAEAIWNQLGRDEWEAVSAGSKPAGYVHPMAIKLMKNRGMPVEGLESKSVEPFLNQKFDLVVTVCDNAKGDCPAFPGAKNVLHWPFEDPNDAEGTGEEKMKVFASVADLIHARINAYLEKLRDDDCV